MVNTPSFCPQNALSASESASTEPVREEVKVSALPPPVLPPEEAVFMNFRVGALPEKSQMSSDQPASIKVWALANSEVVMPSTLVTVGR